MRSAARGREADQGRGADTHEQRQWYAEADWWVAGFTGALFVATFGLWIFTALLYRATKRAVVDGADQTRLARQEFNATHRPRIVLRELKLLVPRSHGETASVQFLIVNAGESDAILGSCDFSLMKRPDGFPDIPSEIPTTTSFSGEVLKPGTVRPCHELSDVFLSEFANSLSKEKWHHDQDLTIIFAGSVTYFDKNEIPRKSAFYRVFDVGRMRFGPGDDPEREYAD